MALPVLDAVLSQMRELYPEDPVVRSMTDVISVETITEGETIRATDVLTAVTALHSILEADYIPGIG